MSMNYCLGGIWVTVTRPGPNIPLVLPIIQELYSPISTPLFKRKCYLLFLKKLTKTSCKRNDTGGLQATFLFLVSSEA